MKKSINSEAVKVQTVEALAIASAEVVAKPEAKPEAVKPSMLEVLKNNIQLVKADDGTTRGKFVRLNKSHFSSAEAWENYTFLLASACVNMEASIDKKLSEAEQGMYANRALKYLIEVYKLIAAETAAQGLVIFKKHLRAWLAVGTFARGKVNYETGEQSIVSKSWKSVQRMVELDIGNILNGRERMTNIVHNATNAKAITDHEQKLADAGKQVENVKPKPEAKPEAQTDAQPQPEAQTDA